MPLIQELAPTYAGRVTFARADVDDTQAMAFRFQVTSVPTMMMFNSGRIIDRMIGAAPRSAIQSFIDRNL